MTQCRSQRPPAAREVLAPEIHPWTGPQLERIPRLGVRADCRDAAAWHVQSYTVARRGEVLALRWRDLALDTGRPAMRRSVGLVRVKEMAPRLVEGPDY